MEKSKIYECLQRWLGTGLLTSTGTSLRNYSHSLWIVVNVSRLRKSLFVFVMHLLIGKFCLKILFAFYINLCMLYRSG